MKMVSTVSTIILEEKGILKCLFCSNIFTVNFYTLKMILIRYHLSVINNSEL